MTNQSKIIIGLLSAIIVLLVGFITFFVIEYRNDDMENTFQPNDNLIDNNTNTDNENNVPNNNVDNANNNDNMNNVSNPNNNVDNVNNNNTNNANNQNNNNQNVNNGSNYISRDDALKIALDDAKLTQSDIRDLDIELDYEYGQNVYEISFDYQRYEYEYYINAENGTIVKSFQEQD